MATYLVGQVPSHGIDVVCERLPLAAHTLDVGRAAELSFCSDLERDPRDLSSEPPQLCHLKDSFQVSSRASDGVGGASAHHVVDGRLELSNFARRANVNHLGKIAVCDSLGDSGDFSDL